MALKVLIALDHSKCAWHAVEYVAQTFGPVPGTEVTLLHILVGSRRFSGMIAAALHNIDQKGRQRLVTAWQVEQEKKWEGLVRRARKRLEDAGIPAPKVTSKFRPRTADVAEDILREAQVGGCNTIVMGRRGLGTARSLLLGSTTQKVAQNSRGCIVTIVR
jgi:nucleotide-binding universal stress UspA family protein